MKNSKAIVCLPLLTGAMLAHACGPSSRNAGTRQAVTPRASSVPTIVEETVIYAAGSREFEGALLRPRTEADAPRPAVIIAHDFLGPGEYQRSVGRKLAAAGYVVLVADFYGRGRRPTNTDEASRFAMEVRADVPALRDAMLAAYRRLGATEGVAKDRIAVIGYSVGGLAALELARAGADLRAVVGLWPILESTRSDDAHAIEAEVLLVVGERDPLVPEAAVEETRSLLRADGTPHEIKVLPGVAHAFTVPGVGTNVSTGFAYDPAADESTWRDVETLLARVAPVQD